MYRERKDPISFNTSVFEYNKEKKCFHRGFPYRFPTSVFLTSQWTKQTIEFVPVGEDDPLFDQDGWDGEQQIYRACGDKKDLTLVLYHDQ